MCGWNLRRWTLCERVGWPFGVSLLELFVSSLHRRGMVRAYATVTWNGGQLGGEGEKEGWNRVIKRDWSNIPTSTVRPAL